MYSILTLLLRLNQNFPEDVIFSVSAVNVLSCVKSEVIDRTFDDSKENFFLKAGKSLTAV